jgi:hypothetical protein
MGKIGREERFYLGVIARKVRAGNHVLPTSIGPFVQKLCGAANKCLLLMA